MLKLSFRNLVVYFGVAILASCAHIPKAPTGDEKLIAGIWTLTTQDRPLNLSDLLQALGLNYADYDDHYEAFALQGWDHVLTLKGDTRAQEGPIVIGAQLTKVLGTSKHASGLNQPEEPLHQSVEIYLRPPHCLSVESIAQQEGVEVGKRVFPGYADVLPATFDVVTWKSPTSDGKVEAVGCARLIYIRKNFAK